MKLIGAVFLAAAMAAALPACTAGPPGRSTTQAATQAATPRIVIYHAEGRRSERVAWLCEELGLPYELKFRRGDVAGSFADIQAINPGMRVAPTVFYNDELLVESGAILQLILDRDGGGRLVPPVNSPDYGVHLKFMHFAEGTLASDVIADYRTARATDGKAPRGETETDGQRAMRYADDHLAKHPWFGGSEFTAADIMMVFPLTTMRLFAPRDLTPYPNIRAYLARIGERPAYRAAMAKGDPTLPLQLS
jgi:glutathione S-transferase